MLRKGYVFLLVVFLCKTLTGISCNNGGNTPAGELEQIFPMLEIFFFFNFLALFSFFPFHGALGLQRSSEPVRLPPVSDTAPCRPMQGLPPRLETTSNAGLLSPYLLWETAQGPVHRGWCPLAAGHTAPGRGRGTRSCLWCWKHCRSTAVC